jgi:molybdate transport system permease protein
MSWARALGEFGATLMFAGNLEGRTQTLPLAIYTALETDLRAAQAISVVLVVVALAVLLLVKALVQRWSGLTPEFGSVEPNSGNDTAHRM